MAQPRCMMCGAAISCGCQIIRNKMDRKFIRIAGMVNNAKKAAAIIDLMEYVVGEGLVIANASQKFAKATADKIEELLEKALMSLYVERLKVCHLLVSRRGIEWRPWSHSEFPRPFRAAAQTLAILAKGAKA